jgi:radical SAM superfamily enzyme YgiQ (UPF0313 family)
MNVLLLYPEFPDTFWSFKHAVKFIGKRAALPPLGLLTVAALLPKDWNLRLVDLNVRRLHEKDLAWADLALVSAMTVQRESARALIARCRRAGLKVVAGGPLFTCEPEAFPEADHLVLGEAELSLPKFLGDFVRGETRPIYAAEGFADLGETPAPRWDLAQTGRYASMSVQYSRGCPFHCEFCNVTALFGHVPRVKPAARIIAELDALYDGGWRGPVFFVDDNLIGNRKSLKADLLPALTDWHRPRPGVAFYTEASINLADDEPLTRGLVAAGFDMVFVGIETPDDAALGECRKTQNVGRDLLADVKKLQNAGLQVQGGFIVGFDSDSESIFQRQIDFIQSSGITTAMVGLLQAPAGTRLHQRLARAGRLRGEMSGDNADHSTNIIPVMNLEKLRAGYERVLRHIYAPRPYYQRVRTFLREFRPPPSRAPLRLPQLMAFTRAFVHLGVVGRERVQYWRLLLWTTVRRPKLLPLAVALAINGYHFRKVFERNFLTAARSRE